MEDENLEHFMAKLNGETNHGLNNASLYVNKAMKHRHLLFCECYSMS